MTDYKGYQSRAIVMETEDDEFDLKKVVGTLIRFWPLFLICVIGAVIIAFLFLRYSTPQYKINAKILVKDDKKGGNFGGASDNMFSDLGLFNPTKSVDNEVEVLKSRTLMEKTVDALQLQARYYVEGSVKQTELFFENVPFELSLAGIKDDSLVADKRFSLLFIDDRRFVLENDGKTKQYNYGDLLVFPFGAIRVKRNINAAPIQKPVIVKLSKRDNVVDGFQQALTIATTSKTVSTIDLTLEDPVPQRGEKLLNTLITIYNAMNTEDKNRIADSTIAFIDNRLIYVTAELGNVEKEIETFKRKNKLTDLSAEGQLLLQNSSEGMKNVAQQQVQIEIINSLEKYLKDDKNNLRTIPAGLAVPDPTFAELIHTYNAAQLEKERQLQTTTESNPIVQTLTVQIGNLKSNILANLATIRHTMQISMNQLQRGANLFERRIGQVPEKERSFLEFSRQQAIKQELYLYLLKKREETAVSKAANIDNARVVDSAKSQTHPFSPKRTLVYLSALLIGLVLPAIAIYLRQLLNNKVEDKKDITTKTAAPIVGEIGRSPYTNSFIVKENPRHPVAEQFRLLRTNLDYMVPEGEGGRVIMITSSISGEGKSFLSLNLAAMLALRGKKVLLVEFDLRKPKLSKYLRLDNRHGLTDFLVKKNNDIGSLIKTVSEVDGLYMLGSGAIPPNPAELINNNQTRDLFSIVKTDFDYAVVDAPPVGLVTDSLLLSKYANITLYVIRQKYTFKNQLEMLDEMYRQGKLPNLGIVVNDIKRQKGYGYGYGYGSGYGYGYESEKDR
jgi:capsular exopolysaccharide synthesis family protein